MVKPIQLTYLAKGGRGGGLVTNPRLEILTIACLTFSLLLTDRPTLGLPEYKLKIINISSGNLIYNLFIGQFNDFKSTGQV